MATTAVGGDKCRRTPLGVPVKIDNFKNNCFTKPTLDIASDHSFYGLLHKTELSSQLAALQRVSLPAIAIANPLLSLQHTATFYYWQTNCF